MRHESVFVSSWFFTILSVKMWQFWVLFAVVSALKLLFIPAYRSTDFEVHRNWLAITNSLPLKRWYFEDRSEWTLDYPPFFAYFEYVLSSVARYFDPEMLKVENLNYASEKTILFQRLSVIITDVVYAFGVRSCLHALKLKDVKKQIMFSTLLLFNVGLLMVDHIHFQYNGILFGLLLLSLAAMISEDYVKSAIYFTVLLHMKHIFIYFAPAYFLYLLRSYCFSGGAGGSALARIMKLGAVVVGISGLSFGPFYDQIPQLLTRLFPFKRGLSHAYWAPNFWALYNFADKTAAILLQRKSAGGGTTTSSGLVQTFDHEVLPNITPFITFVLTGAMMLPCLVKLLILSGNRNVRKEAFIRTITLCGLTSFMFGWHVHEKAILMVLIPISILSTTSGVAAKETLFLSIVGLYSLFPLLHPTNLLFVKLALYLSYVLLQLVTFRSLFNIRFNSIERLYCIGFGPLFVYTEILHRHIEVAATRLPFLPLLLTSVYCAVGVLYFWTTVTFKFVSVRVPQAGGGTIVQQSVVTITKSKSVKKVANAAKKTKDDIKGTIKLEGTLKTKSVDNAASSEKSNKKQKDLKKKDVKRQ